MSKLSPKATSILAAARDDWDPSPDAAARVKAAVDTRVAPSSLRKSSRGTVWSVARRRLPIVAAAVVAGGLIAGVAGSPSTFERRRPGPDPSAIAPVPPVPPAPPGSTETASEVPTIPIAALPDRSPVPPAPRPSVEAPLFAPAASAATAPAADTLAEETRLIRAAQIALRAHRSGEAGRLLDDHAGRFPAGALCEERMALRVLLLCELGEVSRARRERVELDRAFPGTSHSARLESSCAPSVESTTQEGER